MIFVTLVLNYTEWEKVRQAAQSYWPTQQLDTQLSRSECCRRLLFGGMDSLKSTSRANQQQMADGHAQRVEPPADHNMPALPGAPK